MNTSTIIHETPGFLDEIQTNFHKNIDSVNELMKFDRIILDFCLTHLYALNDKLKSNPHIKTNKYLHADNAISAIESIIENGSLKKNYDSMYNQCLVLTISYFTSAINDIFKRSISYTLKNGKKLAFTLEDIKLSFGELQNLIYNNTEDIGEIIINRKDISFQDMQSTNRAFTTYFDFNIERTLT